MDEVVKRIHTIAFIFLIVSSCKNEDHAEPRTIESEEPVDGIRIAWDYKTLRQVSPAEAGYAGYARMIKLHDGTLFCVFESDGNTQAVTSNDGGEHWSEPVMIAARENNIARAVPEVLQLQNQSILVSYNLRPTGNNTNPDKRFAIQVKRSDDGGKHWSSPVQVYTAGHEFKNGCWEPAQIQLPSGEIQLYIANEGPYTQSDEQEITMFRSVDNGTTWTAGEKVSFRSGYRDGMPVPLLLQNKQTILFAIEDNGIDPKEFKPVIIRTTAGNSWSNAPVLASSSDREHALDKLNRVPITKYAGAPYIRQLSSGEVLLSYQGNEYRKDYQWDRSDMIVAIGSSDGRNFNRKSIPFYISDTAKTSLWNSIAIENDTTVIALGSTNGFGDKTAVWMIKGRVLNPIKSRRTIITVDGSASEPLWNGTPSVYIGGYGSTSVRMHTAWSEDMLYLVAEVNDKNVFASSSDAQKDDGIQVYIDPKNLAAIAPVANVFSFTMTAGGKIFYTQGKDGHWVDWNPAGVQMKVLATESGYSIEAAIPWSALNGRPEKDTRIGFHAELRETSNGIKHDYIEPLSGNVADAPYTWSPLFLTD
jgi:hypothetical protein